MPSSSRAQLTELGLGSSTEIVMILPNFSKSSSSLIVDSSSFDVTCTLFVGPCTTLFGGCVLGSWSCCREAEVSLSWNARPIFTRYRTQFFWRIYPWTNTPCCRTYSLRNLLSRHRSTDNHHHQRVRLGADSRLILESFATLSWGVFMSRGSRIPGFFFFFGGDDREGGSRRVWIEILTHQYLANGKNYEKE